MRAREGQVAVVCSVLATWPVSSISHFPADRLESDAVPEISSTPPLPSTQSPSPIYTSLHLPFSLSLSYKHPIASRFILSIEPTFPFPTPFPSFLVLSQKSPLSASSFAASQLLFFQYLFLFFPQGPRAGSNYQPLYPKACVCPPFFILFRTKAKRQGDIRKTPLNSPHSIQKEKLEKTHPPQPARYTPRREKAQPFVFALDRLFAFHIQASSAVALSSSFHIHIASRNNHPPRKNL